MKATAIQLNVNTASIIFFSIYNLPRKITERKLDLLIGTGHKVILAGDFNTKQVKSPLYRIMRLSNLF
jgi:hypothetical protein